MQVRSNQAVFRANEIIGSANAIQLARRVQWWSLIEAFVIVATGFGQVLMTKHFFDDQREMTVIAFDVGYPHSAAPLDNLA